MYTWKKIVIYLFLKCLNTVDKIKIIKTIKIVSVFTLSPITTLHPQII